jgi:hypothetical protein
MASRSLRNRSADSLSSASAAYATAHTTNTGSERWIASVSADTGCRRPGDGPPTTATAEEDQWRRHGDRHAAGEPHLCRGKRQGRQPEEVERAAPVTRREDETTPAELSTAHTVRMCLTPGDTTRTTVLSAAHPTIAASAAPKPRHPSSAAPIATAAVRAPAKGTTQLPAAEPATQRDGNAATRRSARIGGWRAAGRPAGSASS